MEMGKTGIWFAVIVIGVGFPACSSNSHPLTVSFTQSPPTSTGLGTTNTMSATVSNDSSNAGVDWTVTCATSGTCGSFSPTHTASGAVTTYTAPIIVPSGGTVTISAAATADSTVVAQATVTISSTSGGISVFFAVPPPKSLPIDQSTAITAIVINDTSNKGIDWMVSCGTAGACGSLNPAHTASGEFSNYTAPSAVPAGNTVTITASSTVTPTINVQGTITITP